MGVVARAGKPGWGRERIGAALLERPTSVDRVSTPGTEEGTLLGCRPVRLEGELKRVLLLPPTEPSLVPSPGRKGEGALPLFVLKS